MDVQNEVVSPDEVWSRSYSSYTSSVLLKTPRCDTATQLSFSHLCHMNQYYIPYNELKHTSFWKNTFKLCACHKILSGKQSYQSGLFVDIRERLNKQTNKKTLETNS